MTEVNACVFSNPCTLQAMQSLKKCFKMTFFLNAALNVVPSPPAESLNRMYTFIQPVLYLYHTELNVEPKEEMKTAPQTMGEGE